MTSGKKLDRETVNYLRALPEIVRRVQGGRIYYTNSFRAQATARYAMGDLPVDIFRDNGIGPEVIGYKRIERLSPGGEKTRTNYPQSIVGRHVWSASRKKSNTSSSRRRKSDWPRTRRRASNERSV